MEKKRDKTKLTIGVLISVIILLLIIVAYAFLLKPTINGLVVQGYNQGVQDVIIQIAQKASSCQQVPLIIGNQTINIIDVRCLG